MASLQKIAQDWEMIMILVSLISPSAIIAIQREMKGRTRNVTLPNNTLAKGYLQIQLPPQERE